MNFENKDIEMNANKSIYILLKGPETHSMPKRTEARAGTRTEKKNITFCLIKTVISLIEIQMLEILL